MTMTAKTTILIAVIILAILALILGWIFLAPPATLETPAVQEPADAVEALSEGTTIDDVEQDLEQLSQEEQILGDIDKELRHMEQQLEVEGL